MFINKIGKEKATKIDTKPIIVDELNYILYINTISILFLMRRIVISNICQIQLIEHLILNFLNEDLCETLCAFVPSVVKKCRWSFTTEGTKAHKESQRV